MGAVVKIAVTAAGLAILSADAGVAADVPMKIGTYGLQSERLSGETTLVAKNAQVLGEVAVVATVDVDGRVIDAAVDDNFSKLDPAPALAAVRSWRFRPQTFDGKPVIAVGVVRIAYRVPEEREAVAPPFPDAAAADTEIVLERSACYGPCPDYAVSIRGDGTVRFSTGGAAFKGTAGEVHLAYMGNNVLLPGAHIAHVDPATVARLVAKFRNARFFGLKPSYEASITDSPTYKLTVRAGGKTKSVTDYVGTWAGMPEEVSALEDAVDEVAGSARWVSGNATTIKALEGEGFDFHSAAAAELAADAMQLSSSPPQVREAGRLALALIERGAPLGTAVRVEGGVPPIGTAVAPAADTTGALLAYYAAVRGDEALFDALERRGWVTRLPRALRTQALAYGAGCSTVIAKALVRAGADLIQKGSGTLLTALRSGYGVCRDAGEARVLEMAETAIGLGVPLEARDDFNWTALMGCDSPALARLLIAHGANVNARAAEGKTPLLATDDDRVALILLRAGADATARTKDTNVRREAVKGHMPATLGWLDAHEIQ
ncbi:MAG TPA: DUF6438 domain-containing protein [Allosphingosinicella sp.]